MRFAFFRDIKIATNNFWNVEALTKSEQSIIDFLNFCKRFYEQIGCGTDYEVAHFINTLSAFLREEHALEEIIEFFIKKCLVQKTLFKNLYILR